MLFRRRVDVFVSDFYRRDEAEPFLRESADKVLLLAAVADCLSYGIDSAG